MKTIRVVAFASGEPCPIAGQYLESFDFEAHGGKGFGVFTRDIGRAMKFATTSDALEFWKTQSQTAPLRLDGRPNRPLTATTVEITDWHRGEDYDDQDAS